MITVAILINGQPIMARSAVNVSPDLPSDCPHKYKVDDGSTLFHVRDRGAVALAIKLLRTIKEKK